MNRLTWLVVVVLAAACSPPVTPTGTAAAATSAVTAAATATTSATPVPTPPADDGAALAAPPAVSLAVPGAGPIAGELGSYTWGGFSSDGPWIVEPDGQRVQTGAPLEVAVAGITADHWTAAWAQIANGHPRPAVTGGSGRNGAPITVVAPAIPGSWSLRVEAWFGSQGHAAWFWRLEVRP